MCWLTKTSERLFLRIPRLPKSWFFGKDIDPIMFWESRCFLKDSFHRKLKSSLFPMSQVFKNLNLQVRNDIGMDIFAHPDAFRYFPNQVKPVQIPYTSLSTRYQTGMVTMLMIVLVATTSPPYCWLQ